MKKILFIIHSLSSGGAEKVLIDTLKEIEKEFEEFKKEFSKAN
jgi:hypothetical protein